MLELYQTFARLNGRVLKPVFVDYRNFEQVLNGEPREPQPTIRQPAALGARRGATHRR